MSVIEATGKVFELLWPHLRFGLSGIVLGSILHYVILRDRRRARHYNNIRKMLQ